MTSSIQVRCVENLTGKSSHFGYTNSIVKGGLLLVDILDACVKVCLRAYKDEIATDSMVGDESLKDLLFRGMIRAGHLAGKVYTAIDQIADQIVAIAIWFPPGHALFATEDQRALGFNDLMTKLSPETKDWWENIYMPRCHKFIQDIMGPRGVVDLWYLSLIGTDPPYQRQGIATMLLETVFKETAGIDSLLGLCAANDPNAMFYEECGFVQRGRMTLPSLIGPYPVILLTRQTD